MSNEIKKVIRSTRFAMAGLRHAYALDKSFRMEIHYGIPFYLTVAFFLRPFSSAELLIYLFSYVLILVVELVNTAFEKMLDRIHPEYHDLIGKSKDIAAAAVFVTYVFAFITICTIVLSRVVIVTE